MVLPAGLFEFLCLSFGLRNAAQTIQRMTDKIFGNLPFCFIYLDNILFFSNSLASHQQHLRHVFDLCRLHGLTINLEKCTFAASQVEYLGHTVSSSGSTPLSRHVSAISSFSTPADRPALQQFLGMVNFYRKFISGAALLLCPLTDALEVFSQSPKMASAFSITKAQTHMGEWFFSCWFVAPGLPSPSSPGSCPRRSPGTPP